MKLLSLAMLFFCTTLNAYTYIVKVSYDPHDPVELTGHYKGDIINLKDGIDFLHEKELLNSFVFIITAEPPTLSQGAISHLEKPTTPFLWYDISWTKEDSKMAWSVEKREENEMPTRIPEHAIIIYCEPEFIEKVEHKSPHESSSLIHLPTIVLKKNLSSEDKKRRDEKAARSKLAQIDMHHCVAPVAPAVQLVKKGNVVKIARTT